MDDAPRREQIRERLRKPVGEFLGAILLGVGAISFLAIWHLLRRGRLIREGLSPPRDVKLPDVRALLASGAGTEPEPPDDPQTQAPTTAR